MGRKFGFGFEERNDLDYLDKALLFNDLTDLCSLSRENIYQS